MPPGAPWQRCSALARVGARGGDAQRCPRCAPVRGSQVLGTFLPRLFGCSAPRWGAGALVGLWMSQRGEEHSVGCGSCSLGTNGADLHLLSWRAPCSAQGLGCLGSCEHQTPSAVLVWAAGEVRVSGRQQHWRGTPAFLPGFPLAAAHASMG